MDNSSYSMPSKHNHARRGYDDDDYDISYARDSSHHMSGGKKKGGYSACGGWLGGHLDSGREDTSHTMAEIKGYKKKKSEAVKKAQEEFSKSESPSVKTFNDIRNHIKSLHHQLFEFNKSHKKSQRNETSKEEYLSLKTREGVDAAAEIYRTILSMKTHNNLDVKELRAPVFDSGQSYHPRKIVFWYYKAKKTLLTSQYQFYKTHGNNEHTNDHVKHFMHWQSEVEKIIAGLNVWYEANPASAKPSRRTRSTPSTGHA